MLIKLRGFNQSDIPNKVRWINNPEINHFLHYDLPLCEDRTLNWYNSILNKSTRSDFVYEVEHKGQYIPIGLIGLLDISMKNKKAEFYIVNGNTEFHGKGIAYKASVEYLKDSFLKYDLNKVYLYTEVENLAAQKLFEKIGFTKEGCLQQDLFQNEKFIDRFVYGLLRKELINEKG